MDVKGESARLEGVPSRPAFWVAVVGLGQAWKLGLSIASSVILGRLLSPSDFGLVATFAPLVAMADLLRDLGFTQAIIQRKEITSTQINALFWLSVGITFLIAVFLSVISPLVAIFFKEPRLTLLLIAAAWSLLLSSVASLPMAWMSRNLRFSTMAMIESASGTAGLLVAALMAWLTRSYWSLLMASVAYSVTNATLALTLSGWRPGRPKFDEAVRDMMRFGAGVSTANIAGFIARNADNLLIAKADGPGPLGYYDRAYKLMLLPLAQMTWPIARVLTPILTRQIDTPSVYSKTYCTTISYLMICAQPGLLFAVVFAPEVIRLALGKQWGESAPIFAWLGAAALQQLVTSSIAWLFISQGRARQYATQGVLNSAVAVLSFFIGLPWGPVGVAASFTIFDAVLRAPFTWWWATREGPVTGRAVARAVAPHVIALAVCTCFLVATRNLLGSPRPLGMSLYIVSTYILYIAIIAAWPEKRAILVGARTTFWKKSLQIRRRILP